VVAEVLPDRRRVLLTAALDPHLERRELVAVEVGDGGILPDARWIRARLRRRDRGVDARRLEVAERAAVEVVRLDDLRVVRRRLRDGRHLVDAEIVAAVRGVPEAGGLP